MSLKITAEQARAMQLSSQLARFQKQTASATLDDLAPPDPLGLLPPDNLVPLELLLSGVDVNIPKWGRVLLDDVLTLYFRDQPLSPSFKVVDEDMVFPHPMRLLGGDLAIGDGTHGLRYEVVSDSGVVSPSETRPIRIDRSKPNNGNKPPRLIFPPEVETDGVTSEYLAANNDEVIARVSEYSGMEAGQTVTYYWNTIKLGPVTLTAADETAKEVALPIPGAVIRLAGEPGGLVHYYLTSRAGFDGEDSDITPVAVFLTPVPANLQDPLVPLFDDGLVDLSDANDGVEVVVRSYDNARSGDQVVVSWGAQVLLAATVVDPVNGFPLPIPVPRGRVVAEGNGTVQVSYRVYRSGIVTPSWPSSALDVMVDIDAPGPTDPVPETPENEALVRPTVTGDAGGTNELVPADRGKDATATVPFYAEAKIGEIISLYWGKAPAPSQLVSTHTIDQDDLDDGAFPEFTVPAAIIGDGNNPALQVYYTLSNPATGSPPPPPNPVLSPAQPVKVRLVGPGGPGGLEKAVFPDVVGNNWLWLEHVVGGANVTVLPYEEIKLNDDVTLSWQAYSVTSGAPGTEIGGTDDQETITVTTPEQLANGVKFKIPYAKSIEPIGAANPNKQGAIKVSYTVTQDGDSETVPEETLVKIELGAP
jgi:hypothetical protein